MADAPISLEIPNRSLFKAAEVCELLKVQPYVLRSWEAEFPDLGVARAGGGRVYRRSDVELVARISHLLLVDGLTLAGARRRLDDEGPAVAAVNVDAPALDERIGQTARARLSDVKRGLRSILEILAPSGDAAGDSQERLHLAPSPPATSQTAPAAPRKKRLAPGKARGRSSSSPRRKGSA